MSDGPQHVLGSLDTIRARLAEMRQAQIEAGLHPEYRPDGTHRTAVLPEDSTCAEGGLCIDGWVFMTNADALAQVPDPDRLRLDATDAEVRAYESELAYVAKRRRQVLNSTIPCPHCRPNHHAAYRHGHVSASGRKRALGFRWPAPPLADSWEDEPPEGRWDTRPDLS